MSYQLFQSVTGVIEISKEMGGVKGNAVVEDGTDSF